MDTVEYKVGSLMLSCLKSAPSLAELLVQKIKEDGLESSSHKLLDAVEGTEKKKKRTNFSTADGSPSLKKTKREASSVAMAIQNGNAMSDQDASLESGKSSENDVKKKKSKIISLTNGGASLVEHDPSKTSQGEDLSATASPNHEDSDEEESENEKDNSEEEGNSSDVDDEESISGTESEADGKASLESEEIVFSPRGRGTPRGRGGDRGRGRGGDRGRGRGGKSDGGGFACYNCGDEGHRSMECPKRGPMKCYNCQGQGHMSRDCTQARVERGGRGFSRGGNRGFSRGGNRGFSRGSRGTPRGRRGGR